MFKERVMASAAASPTADWHAKVEWLEGQGYPRTVAAYMEAVKQPDGRDRLQWLQQRGYPLGQGVAMAAGVAGAVDALQFVLESGVALDQAGVNFVAQCAAAKGHLAVLQALHARGLSTAAAAKKADRLPAVAWLVEGLGANKVLTAKTFASAARSGSMKLLAWLHEHGCPWDEAVFTAAAGAGCEEQLEWLAAQGCPMGGDGEPFAQAASNGDLATLRCLQRLGCPLGPDNGRAVVRTINVLRVWTSCNRLQLQRGLQWLLERIRTVVDGTRRSRR
ncbi:Ankyrin repeat domain-containing protein [Tetrabaena socialis]|uniref:Ankyrin repeat domain-containing protein n=1 Tax=Tetrabaena socialis TaxID=47790 RepID=A0A2J7ZRF2_9CHLO|nr:Ankyrin repeat domain-containing protein [Tetrabaena socialis]|eukprot:PNH02853.1 Ankyrin repeat domain-containing protein [Tetrabaena socialis]